MSVSSTDKGLLTPDNCTVIFIDHQPQMFSSVANIDRQDLLNNVLVLAKAAKIFGVPVILTAAESKGFCGTITPQLLDLFPDQTTIERSSMNAWDSEEFIAAVKKAGRKNLIHRRSVERGMSGDARIAGIDRWLRRLCGRRCLGRRQQRRTRRCDSPH